MRIQLALNVRDLDEAVAFYSKMFDAKPNKRKPGYANFAIEQPPLKLVLFELPDAPERLNHLGVEVFGDEDVTAATERLKSAGMAHRVEDGATCCYAKANKVWASEPDGLRWEWYRVLEDSETFGEAGAEAPVDVRARSGRGGDAEAVRENVREGYTRVAKEAGAARDAAAEQSRAIGYDDRQLGSVPAEANLGVGCGNPTAIDELRPGEIVVDLGSGAGMDAFLAARAVGPGGRVIGVDMTDAMLEQARENAQKLGLSNVEFRKGLIEKLPIEDESVDVILSNCVINLSPEKERVWAEAYRVLRPGGRAQVSDVVLEHALPPAVLENVEAWVGCVGGAALRSEYLAVIEAAGFRDVEIVREACFGDLIPLEDPRIQELMEELGLSREEAEHHRKAVTSLSIRARK
jgi:SAM-dependent methyltransferase